MRDKSFFKKTEFVFEVDKLVLETLRVLENPSYQNYNNQVCLTGLHEKDSPLTGSGSLLYDYDDEVRILRENPNREEDFKFFLCEFKDSYFFHIYETLSELYDVGRMRLMTLNPKTCYSFHVDKFQRFHLAIMGDSLSCGLISDDIVYKIPIDGHFYLVDTTATHTAFNSSFNKPRTHLVIDIIRKK